MGGSSRLPLNCYASHGAAEPQLQERQRPPRPGSTFQTNTMVTRLHPVMMMEAYHNSPLFRFEIFQRQSLIIRMGDAAMSTEEVRGVVLQG